jgi:hypothetical protein
MLHHFVSTGIHVWVRILSWYRKNMLMLTHFLAALIMSIAQTKTGWATWGVHPMVDFRNSAGHNLSGRHTRARQGALRLVDDDRDILHSRLSNPSFDDCGQDDNVVIAFFTRKVLDCRPRF